uniref:Methylated-DNA--[protein]-cysteine S-methyltransferase n=1 Tax=Thermorudis peleae TaxID=1382356 RepID=A0A831TDC4_9BACT
MVRAVGRPAATRAVSAATSPNPLPLVIPCHRVIGSASSLTGYDSGGALIARLLAWERGGLGAWGAAGRYLEYGTRAHQREAARWKARWARRAARWRSTRSGLRKNQTRSIPATNPPICAQ